MALTLTNTISPTARVIRVTGAVIVEPGYQFRLDDELLELQGFVMPSHTTQLDPHQWYVRRAQGGTLAASHTAGATVKAALVAFVAAADDDPPPDPFASGTSGGGGPVAFSERVLSADVDVPDNEGAVIVGPLDLNGHVINLGSGSAVAVIPADIATLLAAGGQLTSTEFLFTEVAESATYEASLPILAGTVVVDLILYPLAAPWAADYPCAFRISDTLAGAASYGELDLGGLSPAYDPVQQQAVGSSFQNLANNGGAYDTNAWNSSASNAGGPGVLYQADDEIVMALTTVNASPVEPVGILLVKIIYFTPATRVAVVPA